MVSSDALSTTPQQSQIDMSNIQMGDVDERGTQQSMQVFNQNDGMKPRKHEIMN
jgi:hypothetical protein